MVTLIAIFWIIGWFLLLTGSVAKVETKPKQHWWYNTLDWTFWPFMKLFANGLLTHKHHWLSNKTLVKVNWHDALIITIPADLLAQPRRSKNIFSQIIAHLRWKKCVVVKPQYLNIPWQLIFQAIEEKETVEQICTIVLNGPVRLLIGPYTISFAGVTLNGSQFKLELIATTTRDDKKWQHVPLI